MYHPGEIGVQEQAQVRQMAKRVANGVRDFIVPAAIDFLQSQPFVVASISDASGNVWAIPVRGPLDARDARTVRVPTNLTGTVGLVVMDFATRRRIRINGIAEEGLLTVGECYANCPKFLQKREGNTDSDGNFAPVLLPVPMGDALTDSQVAFVRSADTFFIATRNQEMSADASHRGGNPGFVQVLAGNTIRWEDYPGNAMFNTLGNLAVDTRAGLFFPDFATGDALLVSGTARVVWDSSEERSVIFTVQHVAESTNAFAPLNAIPVQYSPFNP